MPRKKSKRQQPSPRTLRQAIRLEALRLGVPVDLLTPPDPTPIPPNPDWSFRENILASYRRP